MCVCICECTRVHVITLCMRGCMYGSVYTCGHECLQVHVCMGVTWGLLPPPQCSWSHPQHLPECAGQWCPWLFSCRCLHVPPPWGHHTGDPPPGQRAPQAGPSSGVGPLRGGGTRLPHHLPLVLLLFLLKGTHMSLFCVAGVRGTHWALHCGHCGCALGGKLLEATEGGAGFGGCACPTSGETSTFQGILALACCIGLNPCGFPQDGQESPAARTFLLRKCSHHIYCVDLLPPRG